MLNLAVLFLALLIDRFVGDPPRLWARVPHPVVFFGKAIDLLDRYLNSSSLTAGVRKRNGVIAIFLLLSLAALFGLMLHRFFGLFGLLGSGLEAILVSVFLAHKSLSDHVAAVADGLRDGGLVGGRRAVSMIVGRDPEVLDQAGIGRAAIESLAENFGDGVVAPAFWYALLGLPGILAYKMLNTADSMIGHKSDKYLNFGWAAARLDDLANWPAARIAAAVIACAAGLRFGLREARRSLVVAARDSGLHRSPNSGWPEAAYAGALNIRLAGPRVYGGVQVREPMINGSGDLVAGERDIRAALKLFAWCGNVLLMVSAILAVVAASFC